MCIKVIREKSKAKSQKQKVKKPKAKSLASEKCRAVTVRHFFITLTVFGWFWRQVGYPADAGPRVRIAVEAKQKGGSERSPGQYYGASYSSLFIKSFANLSFVA